MGQTTAIDIATNFIEERESFRASPYLDTKNVWTIGYGTTILFDGSRVSSHTPPITPAIGVELLTVHIQREVVPYLQKLRNWSRLNVNQQAALISMAYNIGAPSFVEESKVAKDVEAWVPQRIPADMMNWIYETVDGKKVRSNGLINRRTDEGKLFAAPVPAGA